ncbi:MAG: hypothetical protein MK207_04285 [Saprospiraceae bacterium]|nr:hypothetical protein [Saprospiraceae bacterium]
MKQLIPIVWIIIGLVLLTFIGVKKHPDDLNNRMVIIKHRPNFKLEFYSPLQSSKDVKLFEDLSIEEQKEEQLYQEFIKRKEARTIDNLALVFFQFGIYLIVINLLQLIFFRRKTKIKINRFFSINGIGLAVAMGIYQIYWTEDIALWIVITIQIILNIILIFPRLRKNA